MPSLKVSSVVVALLSSVHSLTLYSLAHPSKAHISWTTCGNASLPRECGRFEVPLDYKNPQAGKASLAVARFNATKQPRLGTLFTNPGGPGDSGVGWVLSDDILYLNEGSGGQYDIVSWDPRGVGETTPRVKCFDSMSEEKAFWNGSLHGSYLEVRTDFGDAAVRDKFYSHANEVDGSLIRFGKQCNKASQNMLKYIGTAATVRDMVALHDYLEGTTDINFWGISYGTIIGSYFVNMFPKRVGRVIIDGVVDPWIWTTENPVKLAAQALNSTDAAFNGFAQYCSEAGPSRCAIAQANSTVESIRKWAFSLIESAYDLAATQGGTVLSSGGLRALLWSGIYQPVHWRSFSQNLAEFSDALVNATAVNSNISVENAQPGLRYWNSRSVGNSSDPPTDYAYQAISCADSIDLANATTREGFDEVVVVTQNQTKMFGPHAGWNQGGFYCHHWPSRAVERFKGPFNHKLANKIMVIGNLADPVTPFIFAQRVAGALGESAVLVKHNGYGHTSLYMRSDCTVNATTNYFVKGYLPGDDLVCQVSERSSLCEKAWSHYD